MSEPPLSANVNVNDSPIKRQKTEEVTKEVTEQRNFEVCQPKESIQKYGTIIKKEKRVYIHLKEDENGNLQWSILEVYADPDRDPNHYVLPC